MIAVDTNVLIRLLTGDDPKQAAAAKLLFESESIWIAKTVLLETAWVLRRLYRFEERAVSEALTKLLGLANVHAEDEPSVAAAFVLTKRGIDIADAMHLSSRPPSVRFVSFDRSLIRRATRAGATEISAPAVES